MNEYLDVKQLRQELYSIDVSLGSGGTVAFATTEPCILSKVHREFQTSTEYNPDVYDALIYESEHDATVITFKNGTVATVDAVDTQRAERAISEMTSVVDTISGRPMRNPTVQTSDKVPVPEDRIPSGSELNTEKTGLSNEHRVSESSDESVIETPLDDWNLDTMEKLPATAELTQIERKFDEWQGFREEQFFDQLSSQSDVADAVADPAATNTSFEIAVKRDITVQTVDNQVSEKQIPASEYEERIKTHTPLSEHDHPPVDTDSVVQVVRCGDTPTTCGDCSGEGTIACQNCSNGSITCPKCSGRGTVVCEACDGETIVTCHDCNGQTKRNCPECTGGKTPCESCLGSGMERCSSCYGSGDPPEESELTVCPNCNGNGEVSCHACNGVKQYRCTRCDGQDEIPCKTCGESGSVQCTQCGQDGTVQCSGCDGTGSQDCKECRGKGHSKCYTCNTEGRVVTTEVGEITYTSDQRTEIDSFVNITGIQNAIDDIEMVPVCSDAKTAESNHGTERQRINYAVFPVVSIEYALKDNKPLQHKFAVAGVTPRLLPPDDYPLSTGAKLRRIGKYALLIGTIVVLGLLLLMYGPSLV